MQLTFRDSRVGRSAGRRIVIAAFAVVLGMVAGAAPSAAKGGGPGPPGKGSHEQAATKGDGKGAGQSEGKGAGPGQGRRPPQPQSGGGGKGEQVAPGQGGAKGPPEGGGGRPEHAGAPVESQGGGRSAADRKEVEADGGSTAPVRRTFARLNAAGGVATEGSAARPGGGRPAASETGGTGRRSGVASGSGARGRRSVGDGDRGRRVGRRAEVGSRAGGRGSRPAIGAGGGAFGSYFSTLTPAAEPGTGRQSGNERSARGSSRSRGGGRGPVERVVRRVLTEVIPWPLKALIAGLGAVTVMLLAGSLLTASRARRLARQRESLLRDVGALQGALLPAVPNRVGALHVSAAYRPADGPCAGGDFYDVFPLPGGAVGAVVGDMSGHGRDALAPTAFLRYTVRAHIEAGLGPRAALKLVGEAFERTSPSADFATVLAAVYEPGSGILTYAAAGHPPPIVAGPSSHQPIVVASSPPIGLALRTGLRQTTISLPPGSLACLYTDGLVEARRRGGVLGDARLAEMLAGLGPEASAEELVRRVAAEADHMPDDLAVCLLRPARGAARSSLHLEELEVAPGDVDSARRFLEACGVPAAVSGPTLSHVSGARSPRESVLLRVALGQDPPAVEVLADDAARPPATRRRQAQV